MIKVCNRLETEQAVNHALFSLIQDKDHWKNPIHCIIPARDYDAFNRAVTYFTGGGLCIVGEDKGKLECKGSGYWGNGMG